MGRRHPAVRWGLPPTRDAMMRFLVLASSMLWIQASAQTAPVSSLSVYAELGGPSVMSAGLEVPVAQFGASSAFVRGGVGFVPVVFGGGAIGTVPAALGLAVGLSGSLAAEATAGGVVTFGDAEADPFLFQSGVGLRAAIGRVGLRGGATVLVNPSPDEGDTRAGVVPSLALGIRL